jgi:hypothetical protein
MEMITSSNNLLIIKGSKIRTMLLFYFFYSLGTYLTLSYINRLDSFLWTQLGAAIGIGLAAWQSPDKFFSISEEKVIGPAGFARKMIEIPINQLVLDRIFERSGFDKLTGRIKIRSTIGKTIYISAMDFNSKQRGKILCALGKLYHASR